MCLQEFAAFILPFSQLLDLEREVAKGKTVVLDGCEHDTLKFQFYDICLFPFFIGKNTVDLNQGPRNLDEFYSFTERPVEFKTVRKILGQRYRVSAAGLDQLSVNPHFAPEITSAVTSGSKLVIDLLSCPHVVELPTDLRDRYPTLPGVLVDALSAIRNGVLKMGCSAEKPLCVIDLYERDETTEMISILEELRGLAVPMLIFRTDYGTKASSSKIKADLTLFSQSSNFPAANALIPAQLKSHKRAYVRSPRRLA